MHVTKVVLRFGISSLASIQVSISLEIACTSCGRSEGMGWQ
jgi:hypothetical protein